MFSESSPCLLGQQGSCSAAQRPGELSENMLQNPRNKLPPQTVDIFKKASPSYAWNEVSSLKPFMDKYFESAVRQSVRSRAFSYSPPFLFHRRLLIFRHASSWSQLFLVALYELVQQDCSTREMNQLHFGVNLPSWQSWSILYGLAEWRSDGSVRFLAPTTMQMKRASPSSDPEALFLDTQTAAAAAASKDACCTSLVRAALSNCIPSMGDQTDLMTDWLRAPCGPNLWKLHW